MAAAENILLSQMDVVSVIVPLYNNEAYIDSALNSLLLEKPERIELLILDDGSLDDSLSKAKSWLQRNGFCFYKTGIWSRDNKGIAATLNELVESSSGEYVTILPADDELLQGGIDARIAALQSNRQLLCVFGDARVINHSGELQSGSALFDFPKRHVAAHQWALQNPALLALELIIRWSVPGPVFLARRKVYSVENGIGLYDETLAAEDRDYYLRNLANGTIGYVDIKVANYRVHDSNVSTRTQSSFIIKESVLESERKNLTRFAGINRLALYIAYRYKKSVSSYICSGSVFAKGYYMLQAAMARLIMRLFDFIQIIKRNLS